MPAAEHSCPGGAVAALEGVPPDEGVLQRMQVIAVNQALYGRDVGPIARDGQGQAGVRPAPVDEDGARAALAVVAALLGPGQPQALPEQVEQRHAGVDGQLVFGAVDAQGDFAHPPDGYPLGSTANPG